MSTNQPAEARQLADYVLVFQAVSKKHLRSKTKVPATERAHIASEYDSLLARIRHVGLRVTSRDGAKHSGQILLFVQAPDALLQSLSKQEALSDHLHGVLSVQPAQQRSSSLEKSTGSTASPPPPPPLPITPATRIRYVHQLLTWPQAQLADPRLPPGAGLRIRADPFPNLVDMTPIHDPQYNSVWVKKWAHISPAHILSGVQLTDLDSIREHFGEDIGLYFGFLNYYFQALAPLAIWGLSFWSLGLPYSPVYSAGLVLWACLLVEVWRIKERRLAVRWGTAGVYRVDRRRDDFSPRTTRIDPATEQREEVFEWWRRELRVLLSLPVMLLFASLLAITMTTMFVFEIFVTELYHGPLKQAIPFIPTALLVVAIPQIMAAWQATAAALTSWENHYSSKSHDYSLTLKRFALQGMVAYSALTLSAFVYIPFGEQIMEAMVQRGLFRDSIQSAIQEGKIKPTGIEFHIKPDRMHTQLFAVSVTSQAIGAFTELVLPVLLRKLAEYKAERDDKKKAAKSSRTSATASSSGSSTPVDTHATATPSPAEADEARFLRRVRKELELPPYDLFGDYAEMATQFGYITLWSVIWPLSPVMGFINNFFELRSDAAKICVNQRRPVPLRAETIGPWLEVIGFIAWLSALSNSALVYLFQQSDDARLPGHSAYETRMRTHLHSPTSAQPVQSPLSFSRLLPANVPTSGPAGALVAAVLVALTSEHAYGLFRSGVRHVLERLFWRGSHEEMLVRRREWHLRLDTMRARAAETDTHSPSATVAQDPPSEFWVASKDVGPDVIRNSGKAE